MQDVDLPNPGEGTMNNGLLVAALLGGTIFLTSSDVSLAQDSIDPNSLITIEPGAFTVEGATKIDVDTAWELHQAGVLFVDARTADFFRLGHIPGAVLLDATSSLTEESLAEHAEKDQQVVFYCEYPRCFRSAVGSAKAVAWGFTKVLYFADGTEAWEKAGLPIEKE
jgi:rhodanese-related sulfurtransferase